MVGSATAPGAPHAAEPEPRTERAERVTRPAPLREPRNVHERLRAICADAGYRSADFDACAAAIGDACRRSGVPAETPGCWQWLVDRDAAGKLDRRSLQRGAKPADGVAGMPGARADGLVELPVLRAAGLSAREAAGVLRRAGTMNARAAARALHAARYQPRAIEQAVAEHYRLSRGQAVRIVQATLRERPSVMADPDPVRGREVTICVRPDGALVECAAGSSPTGGRLAGGPYQSVTAPASSAPEGPATATGLSDWMVPDATGQHWHNSYMLALVAYYIYSDALGSPATSQAEFRALMQSWGMEDVQFAEAANVHLRGAVAWGPDLVVVVFRGSELQTTAHCVLEMLFPGICAGLPANWVTNLSFAPMRQRPEWGPTLHLRTHPGFDAAVAELFPDLIDRVKAELTPSRRLFVTGHSLGGAMATLFAFRAQALEQVPVQGVYTYGAPRLMNVPFAAHYQSQLGPRTHRWQNRSDPAPALPPGQPIGENPFPPLPALVARETYRHAGRLHYMPHGSSTDVDRSTEPVDLPGSIEQAMVGDHMMARTASSYVNRIHDRLSSSSRSTLPPPP
jgi:hypothetical protein